MQWDKTTTVAAKKQRKPDHKTRNKHTVFFFTTGKTTQGMFSLAKPTRYCNESGSGDKWLTGTGLRRRFPKATSFECESEGGDRLHPSFWCHFSRWCERPRLIPFIHNCCLVQEMAINSLFFYPINPIKMDFGKAIIWQLGTFTEQTGRERETGADIQNQTNLHTEREKQEEDVPTNSKSKNLGNI